MSWSLFNVALLLIVNLFKFLRDAPSMTDFYFDYVPREMFILVD